MTLYHCTEKGNIPFTAEEQAEWDAEQAAFLLDADNRTAAEARAKRDDLLTDSDWTQVADAPVDQAAWAAYRQSLRDIPEQEGFPNTINWPTEP